MTAMPPGDDFWNQQPHGTPPPQGPPPPYTQYGWAPGQPPFTQQPSPPLPPDQERLWGMLAHLSGFAAAYIALGLVGPLIVMLVFGPRSAWVRANAVEALNFNISWLIYCTVSAILILVGIGILMLIVLGVAYVVLVVIAATRANAGVPYRYPFTIRFVS